MRRQLDLLKVRRKVPEGTKLIERGVAPQSVTFVEAGKVEITVPAEDKSIHLAIAGPGKVFGLRAAVADALPEINVRCLEECTVSEVPREKFLDSVRANGKAYIAIARVLSADLKMADDLRRRLSGREKRMC
ncbi:MAG: cyclic nucleotide-binding domain-containing protein [Acidobacteriia bacterium]|nr:cyclic nucleotide-binding domain-containing protein [Terriglobia bacterium]